MPFGAAGELDLLYLRRVESVLARDCHLELLRFISLHGSAVK
jgi:hypothetical protein